MLKKLLTKKYVKRFWSYVDIKSENECWLWKLSHSRRYGQFTIGRGKCFTTHRVAMTLKIKKDIPAGLYVCHSCDIMKCCNPNHLFLGTAKDNSEDSKRKGRTLDGEKHPRTKLTDEIVIKMVNLKIDGTMTNSEISKILKLSKSLVNSILSGKRWNNKTVSAKYRDDRKEIIKKVNMYNCGHLDYYEWSSSHTR